MWSCGGACDSVGAATIADPGGSSRWKNARSCGDGFSPTIRTGTLSRRYDSSTVASRFRSPGLSSRSLTSTTVAWCGLATAIECARSMPAEIRVPPLNVACHGLGGKVTAKPGRTCCGSVK